jgi:hypothetical protein
VTIAIENTLALGSNQQSKVVGANEYFGGEVLGMQLEELKHNEEQQQLAHFICNNMDVNSSTAILLFTSPETIACPIWLESIEHLIEKRY